jgi:hypothetical protein
MENKQWRSKKKREIMRREHQRKKLNKMEKVR